MRPFCKLMIWIRVPIGNRSLNPLRGMPVLILRISKHQKPPAVAPTLRTMEEELSMPPPTGLFS